MPAITKFRRTKEPTAATSKKKNKVADRQQRCFRENKLKTKLLETVKKVPKEGNYRTDNMTEAHGHGGLRIHPYDADLNPTELVWADVKCLNT
jgi:transposase